LRRSNVLRIAWADVQRQGEFTRLIFRQKKTGGQEYLDIPPQAAVLMGERGADDEHPFGDIYSPLPAAPTRLSSVGCFGQE